MLENNNLMKLIIEDDEGRKTSVPFVRDELTIGRQEGNTIRLTERNVSRRHARLMRQPGHVVVEDLGSYNGIRVNGDRIAGQVSVGDGDLIQIGDYDLAIQIDDPQATRPLDHTRPLSDLNPRPNGIPESSETIPALPAIEAPQASDSDVRDLTPPPLASGKNQSTAVIRIDQVEGARKTASKSVADVPLSEAPRLVILNTEFAGREFACQKTEVNVGRTEDNDIAIDHRSLSRAHCKILKEADEWRIVDLQSANGLMVNGESYAQVTLRSGDIIELGHVKIKFVGPGESFAPSEPAPSSESFEISPPVEGRSKLPLAATILGALVIVLGVGGYLNWKSGQSPAGALSKRADVKPAPTEPPIVSPEETPVVREDPAIAQKINNDRIAKARVAIERLDFVAAELLLRECKIDGSPHPEAQELLNEMDGERGKRNALDDAEKMLDSGNLGGAKTQLVAAADTKLLRAKYAELEKRRADIVNKAVSKESEIKSVAPVAKLLQPTAESVMDEAIALKNSGKMAEAIVTAEKALKLDSKNPETYLRLGVWYAKTWQTNGNPAAKENSKTYYQTFMKLAGPEHPKYKQVETILLEGK
jgi:ABC transport system ATP-binding/permease protein